jgi:hypothetical protein
VGWAEQPEVRQRFEELFVKELEANGIGAVPSYTVLPAMTKESEAVAEATRLSGVDGVIITRAVDTQTTPTAVPLQPSNSGDMALYRDTNPSSPVLTAGQASQHEAILDTDVFEVVTGKMVWWGRTSSFDTDDAGRIGAGTATRVVRALRSAKLL